MSQIASLAPSSEDPLISLSAMLKAAGDPLRLEILRVLARGSYGVLELCQIFGIKQSAMSHHLKVLANAALVTTRREGNSIYYRRTYTPADHPQYRLKTALFGQLDTLPLDADTEQRLTLVQRERTQASQAFFAENADKFHEQQDLIASYPVYGQQVAELLRHTPHRTRTALEIGPGAGEFLRELSPAFDRVYALDNAPAMLARSRALVEEEQLDNVTCLPGDTRVALEKKLSMDCIVINMVLHHTPNPGDIFRDAAALLQPGSILLVTDLCRHDQQWARESCGDQWLGFEPQDLSEWASAADLAEGEQVYFALRNGFQVQLRHFFKPDIGV